MSILSEGMVKKASAYVMDWKVSSLVKCVRDDVMRFAPSAKKDDIIPQYGMVVKELIAKADPANLKNARDNVKDSSEKMCGRIIRLKERRGEKFILLMNDRIVDGHHFLAKAERGNVTSSLPVLDLTPLRLKKTAEYLQEYLDEANSILNPS